MNGLMDVLPEAERVRARREDGWTGVVQAVFLRALADCGVVETAAAAAGLSGAGAYAFRRRADGALFHLGWEGSLQLARRRLFDTLLARAIDGQVETLTREDNVGKRHRHDNRLGCTLLGRLDRHVSDAVDGEEPMAARMVAQDFERFVTMIEAGAGGMEAALFLEAARARYEARMAAVFGVDAGRNGHSQLKDASDVLAVEEADEGADGEPPQDEPVWRDMDGDWVTNFPPPPEFDDRQEGRFGDEDYERALTAPELAVALAREEADLAGLRATGDTARDHWFGFVPAPSTPPKPARKAASLPVEGEGAPVGEADVSGEPEAGVHTVSPWPRPDYGLFPPWAQRIA